MILDLFFAAHSCRFLSALSCLFVLGMGSTLPFWVRCKGSAWYWFSTGTMFSYVSECLWISWGVDETPLSVNWDSRPVLSSVTLNGNLRWSMKYLNDGSNWTNAAIHQMHCAAKRYDRSSKVTNSLPKVQSIISASGSKVILIKGAGLPL